MSAAGRLIESPNSQSQPERRRRREPRSTRLQQLLQLLHRGLLLTPHERIVPSSASFSSARSIGTDNGWTLGRRRSRWAAAASWAAHRPRTTSIPLITSDSFLGGSFPTRSVKHCRSKVTICDPFATDSFGRPVTPADKRTFPGASAHVRLLVNGTQTTVASRLRFKASPWTTTTGRRNPGPDPVGSGRSAHQVSPCAISTTRSAPGSADRQPRRMRRSAPSADPRCGSSLQ